MTSLVMTDDLDRHAKSWQDDGFVVVPELIPGAEVRSAFEQVRTLTPGPFEQASPSRNTTDNGPVDGPAFRKDQFGGTTLFPFADAPDLNALVLHPRLIEFARKALGADDIRLYQARAWSKYSGTVNYEQPLHRDMNHSLVPTRSEPGWWHLETFLYLHDLDETNGATKVVPMHVSDRGTYGTRPLTPDVAPELYEAEVSASGPAGSLMAYRSDVWHRGVDLPPDTERHLLILAFRPAGVDWIDYDPLPPLVINGDFQRFAATCTPDQLSVLGIPRPGHPYWTEAMVDAFAVQYPGLDVTPWRNALD